MPSASSRTGPSADTVSPMPASNGRWLPPGWTSAWRTPTWEAMVASARAGAFDVLVVGYVSRFLRNLKQTLIAVEDHLHAAGVVVLFADERLLSSDPLNWVQFVREAHEAEAYSRKLSKRV